MGYNTSTSRYWYVVRLKGLTRKTMCLAEKNLSFVKNAMNKNPILELVKYVLPSDLINYFEIVSIKEISETLHMYLDEYNIIPSDYASLALLPNGFYPESMIKDFPLRDRKVVLHVRRRRWVDDQGRSHSRRWDLVAEGTRYSKEFAFF